MNTLEKRSSSAKAASLKVLLLAEVISEKYKEGRYRDKALKFVEYFGGMETCVLSNLVAKNPNYDPFRLAVEYNKAQKLMSASNKPLSSSLQNTVVTDPDISLKLSGLECADSGKSPNPLSSEAVLQGRATLPTSGDEKVPLDEMKTSEVHGIREQLHSSKLIDLNTRKQEVFVPFAEGWFTYSPGVLQDRDAIENAREILNKAKLLPWGISIAMMKLGLFTNGCRVCCLENFSSLHESFYHFLSENHLRKVSENKNGRCRFTKFDTELAEKVLKEAQKVSSCREVADVQAEVKSSKEPLKVPRNRNRRSASAFFRTFFELLGGVPLMIGEPRLPSTSLKGDEAFYLHNNLFEAFGKIDKNHLETFLSEIGDLKMTCSLCDTDGSEGLETDELITHLISSLHRRNLLRDSSISLNDAEIWLIILRELAEPIECSIKCKVSMEASLAHSASKHVDPSGGITASSAETNCSMDEQSLKDNFQLKVKEDPEKGKERSPVLEKLPTPEACGTTSKTPEKPKNPTGEPQPSKNLKTGIKIAQDINLALFVAQTRDVDEKTRKLSDEERQIALDFLRETYKKHGMERTSKAKLNGKKIAELFSGRPRSTEGPPTCGVFEGGRGRPLVRVNSVDP
ncbi:unnamed protein product [Caenorhabditis auriculariae]|uniref:Uncharacterized protein n=1 Tax=Caenorhabditis auriculariae TaxID=2777116 RepID=A0A8S1GV74_9PELO|nr:unnamed protein product [Caenorhabditis auriculariae]